jgi:UDP-N-acetylmuramoyl-tripeptide--D-alanyl-D-alanine ligase
MTLDLQEVARAMRAAGNRPRFPSTGWSVDTRTQNPGDVYFALRGPNHDGHDYVRQSAAARARPAVVVERTNRRAGMNWW